MTIKEFMALGELQQADQLLHSAIYIGKENRNKQVSAVYQLDSFYVKLIYADYRKEVLNIECYTSPDDIESFIDQVSIENLLTNILMKP